MKASSHLINRSSKYVVSVLLSLLFIGCFTHYTKYQKTPCADLGDSKEAFRKISLSSGYKENDFVITDQSIKYTKKKAIVFSDVFKAWIKTKKTLSGKRYTIVTAMKNRDQHFFFTHDFNLAIQVYSAIECYGGIKPKSNKAATDKFDRIAKLKSLLDSKAITNEEFEKEKEKILNEN